MVPFVDLKTQYLSIKDDVLREITNVLDNTLFILGDHVARFEAEFAAYSGCEHAIALSSGTAALHLAFLAVGIGPGDEVITTPATFCATVAAIEYAGAKPVLADVDPHRLTLDPIREICKRRGVMLIEDAAQAHGAEYKGKRAGSFGPVGCFSFYPGKNLGAYGEGGAVTTSDAALAKKLRMLRDWGQEGKANHVMRGFNYRMDGVQGAVLGVKMKHIEAWTEARRRIAQRYDAAFSALGLETPANPADARHVYHVYAMRFDGRDAIRAKLEARGVQTGIHYPKPVHLQPAYADLGYAAGSLPVSERASQRLLSLPMFPEMTDAQVDTVIAAVRDIARAAA
jgi:dTDP-4-amino-4,6-dideoxygalactose transaminase